MPLPEFHQWAGKLADELSERYHEFTIPGLENTPQVGNIGLPKKPLTTPRHTADYVRKVKLTAGVPVVPCAHCGKYYPTAKPEYYDHQRSVCGYACYRTKYPDGVPAHEDLA